MFVLFFIPRKIMNSTRNFTNSSNAQDSASFKDKLKELTTGVALAGTLLMGTACENNTSTTADQQKDKIENVEVKADEQTTDSITDMDEFYKNAALKAAIAEQEDIAEELDMEIEENKAVINENKAVINENKAAIRWYEASNYASMERQAKDRETVTPEELNSNKDLQKALLGYLKDCKEVGYEPSAHCKKLLASIKK